MKKNTLVIVMHREIVFVNVQSSVIELSEIQYCIGTPRNSQPNNIPSTNAIQNNLCITLKNYGRVRIEIKHLYPCVIAVIKYGYSF